MSSTRSQSIKAITIAGLMALGGCATSAGGPTIQGSHAEGEAATGAGIGALLGAVIGHQSGKTNEGAVIGGLLGGAVGYLHGRAEDLEQAKKLAAQARQDGYTAQVETATVQDPQTHAPVQVFKGFHLALPANNVAQGDPQSLVMLRQCGALAVKADTSVTASGPTGLQPAVLKALALPGNRVQYQPADDDQNVHINVVAKQA